MFPRIRLRIGIALLAATVGVPPASPGHAAAQQRDARIPEFGQLWLEISPTLRDWNEQFAFDSPDLADGEREPLFADYDGLIADRLFPEPQTFIDDFNADADALGFTPVQGNAFSFGRLDYSDINAQIRELAAGFEFGVYDRIAVGIRAPFTLAQIDPAFVYDSATATVTYAQNAFPAGNAFLSDAGQALVQLDQLIAGGTLMGQELADAMALRADTDAFLGALQARVDDNRLVPTGGSSAGLQMLTGFGDLVAAFDALGLALPALELPETATAADLATLFASDAILAPLPQPVSSGLTLGEVELSARVNLIDGITPEYAPRVEPPPTDGEEAAGVAVQEGVETVSGGAAPDSAIGARPPERRERGTIRLRTTIGGLVRIPTASNGAPPLLLPGVFLQLPISDGQMDVELSLYQDVTIGEWFLMRAVGRYGIQMADDLLLRVHPPDRPYALATTEAAVRRDLGDYFQVTLRPSVRLNSALWVGLEYDYWRVGDASFSVLDSAFDVTDATPLEVETGETRHMVGLGLTYDLTDARGRDDVVADQRPIRSPWQFQISMRRSIAGSGGQTPAPFMYRATMRIPIKVF